MPSRPLWTVIWITAERRQTCENLLCGTTRSANPIEQRATLEKGGSHVHPLYAVSIRDCIAEGDLAKMKSLVAEAEKFVFQHGNVGAAARGAQGWDREGEVQETLSHRNRGSRLGPSEPQAKTQFLGVY